MALAGVFPCVTSAVNAWFNTQSCNYGFITPQSAAQLVDGINSALQSTVAQQPDYCGINWNMLGNGVTAVQLATQWVSSNTLPLLNQSSMATGGCSAVDVQAFGQTLSMQMYNQVSFAVIQGNPSAAASSAATPPVVYVGVIVGALILCVAVYAFSRHGRSQHPLQEASQEASR